MPTTPPPAAFPPPKKSGGCLKFFFGVALLIAALYFGASSCSSGSSDPTDQTPPATTNFQDNSVQTPTQDFSITQSCDEIRADYMNAPAGSQEEKWALEAADEACFAP